MHFLICKAFPRLIVNMMELLDEKQQSAL